MPDPRSTPPAFGDLLRRLRRAAGLTQEELAERATLSAHAVSDLERGVNRRPQRETLRLLMDALALAPEERALLEGAARGAAPVTVPAPAGAMHLPAPITSLIGRGREVALARTLIRCEAVRLLTVTGPGGVGKTRLAIEIAAHLRADFPDGIFFVSLGTVRDPDLLLATVARTVGVREARAESPFDCLVTHLHERRALLVLDNFEHLMSEAIAVANLLAHCPHVTILATSRAPLHLRGEHELPVPPLPLPENGRDRDPAALSQSPAIQLFCQRARAVAPNFRLSAANARTVAAICARLDCLPLALELAAARIKFVPPDALLARMERRLPELTDGPRDLPMRQRTMRDTLDWSYEIIGEPEKRLFIRLAVFVGGWDVDGARAVMGEDNTRTWDMLLTLADHHLIHEDERADEGTRFSMLEVIREYAGERLAERGETGTIRHRHALHFLGFAEAAEPYLRGQTQATWVPRLDREHNNLRAALGWARDARQPVIGLRLAGALWRYWYSRSFYSEGRAWLEEFLTATRDAPDVTPAMRAKALIGVAHLADRQGDYAYEVVCAEQSLTLYRAIGDRRGIATVLTCLGNVALDQSEFPQAIARYTESLALLRELGDQVGVATLLSNLGRVVRFQGEYARATAYFAESEAIRRALGDKEGMAIAIGNLGHMARDCGELARARPLLEESLALRRELGDARGIGIALNQLAILAHDEGDTRRAQALADESLTLRREIGDKWGIANSLATLGDLARVAGDAPTAATCYAEALALNRTVGYLLGVAECLERQGLLAVTRREWENAARRLGEAAALRANIGAPIPPADRPAVDRAIAEVRAALGPATLSAEGTPAHTKPEMAGLIAPEQ